MQLNRLSIFAATVGLVSLSGFAEAQTTTWFETSAARSGGTSTSGAYSTPTPQYPAVPTQVEQGGTGGFSRHADASRLIADGLSTQYDPASPGNTLTSIGVSLHVNDADVFKIHVPNPETFSARVGGFYSAGDFIGQATGASVSLFLFDVNGVAIRGGTARQDWVTNGTPTINEGANVVLTLPAGSSAGDYWIGISRNITNAFNATEDGFKPTDVIVPRNNAGDNLFDEAQLLANPGTVYDVQPLADKTLSTDRLTSWQVTPFDQYAADPLTGTNPVAVDWTVAGTGFSSSNSIFFTGAEFAVVPEPATLGLLAMATLPVMRRRRSR